MAVTNGSQGPVVVGICVAFAALTFVVLVLRLFARIYVLGQMGVDDCKWIMLDLFYQHYTDIFRPYCWRLCRQNGLHNQTMVITNGNRHCLGHLLLSHLSVCSTFASYGYLQKANII